MIRILSYRSEKIDVPPVRNQPDEPNWARKGPSSGGQDGQNRAFFKGKQQPSVPPAIDSELAGR